MLDRPALLVGQPGGSIAGAALVVFRFVQPLVASLRHGLVVAAIIPAGPDAFSIEFTGRRLDALRAEAGQYLHWRFLTRGLWWQQHPFSLSAAPTANGLRITVRGLGRGSRELRALRPGTRVWIEGPYGGFTGRARTTHRVALIGAGIGITPIRALLETLAFAPGQATVILRASAADQLYLLDEIERLCEVRGARLVTLLGHREPGRWVPEGSRALRLDDLVPDLCDTDLYVCGPKGFARTVIGEAEAAGVPRDRINVEELAW